MVGMDDKPVLKKNLEKEEKSSYITRASEHGMIIFDYDRDCIFETNDSGTMVLGLLDGENTVDDIINAILEVYDTTRDCVECDMIEFMKKMEEYKLLVK